MILLSFDLELNQNPNGPKIIEIGACAGCTKTGEILDRFSVFVNPNEKLEDKIISLTSITQDDVDNGTTLVDAYNQLINFARKNKCAKIPVVWGMGDGRALRSELPKDTNWELARRELDAKAVFQAYKIANFDKYSSGLEKSMKSLGLTFQGRPHRAVDDAINTFHIFFELLKKLGFKEQLGKKIKGEKYEKIILTESNFVADVKYDYVSNIFVGQVVNINADIKFKAKDYSMLQHEFSESLKSYFDKCKQENIASKSPQIMPKEFWQFVQN